MRNRQKLAKTCKSRSGVEAVLEQSPWSMGSEAVSRQMSNLNWLLPALLVLVKHQVLFLAVHLQEPCSCLVLKTATEESSTVI